MVKRRHQTMPTISPHPDQTDKDSGSNGCSSMPTIPERQRLTISPPESRAGLRPDLNRAATAFKSERNDAPFGQSTSECRTIMLDPAGADEIIAAGIFNCTVPAMFCPKSTTHPPAGAVAVRGYHRMERGVKAEHWRTCGITCARSTPTPGSSGDGSTGGGCHRAASTADVLRASVRARPLSLVLLRITEGGTFTATDPSALK